MKGEGKMVLKSKMKWVGLVGLVLSAISLFVHFLLARFTEEGFSEFHSSITIFPRRAIGESLNFSKTVIARNPHKDLIFLCFVLHFSHKDSVFVQNLISYCPHVVFLSGV